MHEGGRASGFSIRVGATSMPRRCADACEVAPGWRSSPSGGACRPARVDRRDGQRLCGHARRRDDGAPIRALCGGFRESRYSPMRPAFASGTFSGSSAVDSTGIRLVVGVRLQWIAQPVRAISAYVHALATDVEQPAGRHSRRPQVVKTWGGEDVVVLAGGLDLYDDLSSDRYIRDSMADDDTPVMNLDRGSADRELRRVQRTAPRLRWSGRGAEVAGIHSRVRLTRRRD